MAAFITMNRRNDQSGNDNELNQLIISTTAAAEENDVSDSDFTNSSDNESEDEQTLNKAAASSVEDDHPEQAVVVTAATEEDDPLLIYKDVGYINFSATGQASIGQLLKEAMVRQGYDCFKNADANFAKEEFGSKATVRGMTQNWFVKQLKNGIVVPRTWLMYSPRNKAAFCFCCLLFPSSQLNRGHRLN